MTYGNMKKMKDFVEKYLKGRENLRILEVGSLDLSKHGDWVFRRYFDKPNWEFIGLDIEAGRNVDVVSEHPYKYPYPDNVFDVVISGSTLEHVEDIYKITKEIARLSREYVVIMVPSQCPLHRHPIDCWRIMPDGMRFLLEEVAGLKVLECGIIRKETFDIAKKV